MNRIWAEIDLNALKNNAEATARIAGGARVIAVVKADAYGHRAVEISRVLAKCPAVEMLGVSSVDEGLELRESGISAPILVMGATPDFRAAESVRAGLVSSALTENCAAALSKAAAACGRPAVFHLKIDTGMGRLGAAKSDVFAIMEKTRTLPGLKFDGVFTHLASSFSPRPEPTLAQISDFNLLVSELEKSGFSPRLKHIANSAAVQRFPQSFANAVRPGIMLYGSPFQNQNPRGLRPVMTVKTSVVRLRKMAAGKPVGYGGTFVTKTPSLLAVIPVGYKDGYFRKLSNRAMVSINGVAAPVAGEVCMDFTTVDVTGIGGIKIGSEAVLFGDAAVSVEDAAQWAETIPYEVMTAVGGRVKKIFTSPEKLSGGEI